MSTMHGGRGRGMTRDGTNNGAGTPRNDFAASSSSPRARSAVRRKPQKAPKRNLKSPGETDSADLRRCAPRNSSPLFDRPLIDRSRSRKRYSSRKFSFTRFKISRANRRDLSASYYAIFVRRCEKCDKESTAVGRSERIINTRISCAVINRRGKKCITTHSLLRQVKIAKRATVDHLRFSATCVEYICTFRSSECSNIIAQRK